MWSYCQLSQKLLFRDILRINCHNGFKYDSINFQKQRKQPAKYQNLIIASLKTDSSTRMLNIQN